MTSPSGDREHRVVYRAIADFANFHQESRKARDELRRMQADQAAASKAAVDGDRATEASSRRRSQATSETTKVVQDSTKATTENAKAVREQAQSLDVSSKGHKMIQDTIEQVVKAVKEETQSLDVSSKGHKMIQDTIEQVVKSRTKATETTKRGRDELGRFVKGEQDAKEPTSELTRWIDKLKDAIDKAGISAQREGKNLGNMGALIFAGITALVSAAVPLLATATYAVGAFGAAFTAAGVLSAAFAVAAVGNLKKVAEAMKEAEKNGTPVSSDYAGMAKALKQVQAQWEAFLRSTQVPVFQTAITALGFVQTFLSAIQPLVGAFAKGFQVAAGYIADALDSQQFADFMAFVGQEGPMAIALFTRALLNIGSAFASLITAFKPFEQGFMVGLDNLTKRFADWAAQMAQSDGFKNFVSYVQQVGPIVMSTLGSLWDALVNIVRALAPLGPVVLMVAGALADFIAAMPPEVLAAIIAGVLGLVVAFKAMQIVSTISAAITAFTEVVGGAATAMRIFQASLGVLGLVMAGVATAVALMSSNNSDAAKTTDDYRASVSDLADAIHKKNGAVDEELRLQAAKKLADADLLKAAKELGGIDLGEMANAFLGDDKAFRDKLEGRRKGLQEQKDAIDAYNMAGASGNKSDWGITNDNPGPELDRLNAFLGKYDSLKGALNVEIDQQKFIDQIMGRQSSALDKQNSQLAAQAAAVGTVATEYEKLAAKSKPEQDMDKAVQAYDAWANSVKSLNDARRNQALVSENSAKSIQSALRSQAQAERSLADAQKATTRAQQDLTQARKDAVQQILDAQKVLRDTPDTEEAARLRLAQAQLSYDQNRRVLKPTGAGLQVGQVLSEEIQKWEIGRRESALALREAQKNLDDTLSGNARARDDAEVTVSKGIEGNTLVLDAKERLARAQQSELDANVALRDSVENLRVAHRDAAKAVEDASLQVQVLEKQTHLAADAADREAISVGLTKDQVNLYRNEMSKIRDRVETEIALLDPGDAVGKLRLIQTEIEALKLMALNPTMTFDEAWNQAQGKINAAQTLTQQTAARQAAAAKYEASPRLQGNGGWGSAGLAEGGRVFGEGGPKQDKVKARLSPGEFVQPVDTVNHYGAGFMEALRKREIPREVAQLAFADGGLVKDAGAGTLAFPFNLDIGKLNFAQLMRNSGFMEMAKRRINEVLGAPDLSGVDYKGPDPTGSVKALIAWAKRFDNSIQMTSGYRPGSRSSSGNMDYHSQGLAADFGGSNQAMKNVAKGFMSIKDRLLELIHSQQPGYGVKNGKDVGLGFYGSEAANHFDHVHVAARKESLGVRDSNAPSNINEPPGAGVERWRQTVLQALQIVGQPASYADITLRRMQQESSGNPRAINNWDINAINGTPSKGLMQVIDPTFRAYRDPSLSSDVWDPLANVVASMRYAVNRYGSLPAAYNRAGGYAEGGPVFDPAMLLQGLNGAVQRPRAMSVPAQGSGPAQISPSDLTIGANGSGRGGVVFEGDVTVNNPVREPAASSLRRQLDLYVSVGDRA